jgi:aminoglycoside/choline kinase family phosphotransferase
MKTYVSLKSPESINGEIKLLPAYDELHFVARVDLLNDWMYLLKKERDRQIMESRKAYDRSKANAGRG